MKIRAWVDHSQEHTPRRREVFVHKVDILQLPSGSKDYTTVGNSGQPYTFRSITFLLTICNVAPSVTPEVTRGQRFTPQPLMHAATAPWYALGHQGSASTVGLLCCLLVLHAVHPRHVVQGSGVQQHHHAGLL